VPEGDTIHRTADRLRAALAGQAVVRVDAPRATGRAPAIGTLIDDVAAQGKHLRIHFHDGTTLRTHMRMSGSWHLYRTGERWRQPAHLARAVIEVDGWVAVCFAAPVVAFERDDHSTAHLGPDLLASDFSDRDIDDAVARLRALDPATEIGVALLDQRVAAGIGNVFRSEVLYACRVNPLTPVPAVDDETAHRLFATASRLLRAPNRPGAVYRRERQPCLRCGTPILRQRIGEQARSTYWCPTCQPRIQ
jgi:endonuclease-8